MFNFGAKRKQQEELEQQAEMKTAFQEFNRLKKHEKRFTLDFNALSRRPKHRVFIYNGLMKHVSGQREIDNFGKFHAVAFTSSKYELWKKKQGILSFPVAVPKVNRLVPCLPVKGELWEISTDGICDLDFALENGVEFERVRVDVTIPYREVVFLKQRVERPRGPTQEPELLSTVNSFIEKTMTVSAWMYVGKKEYWTNFMDGGYVMSPVTIYRPDHYNEQYYFFSNREFDD